MAGYPEAHPDAIVSDADEMDKVYWKDVHYLKEKVRASVERVREVCFSVAK